MAMVPKREPPASLKEWSRNLFSRSSSTSSLATDDQKARKKAQVEAELQEAISTLKRPNRAVVGKEIVEETERLRASTSLSQLKKSRKPVRDPAFGRTATAPAIQVKATPANNRFRDVIAAESKAQLMSILQEEEVVKDEHVEDEDRIPASSSVVPSSAAPRRVATRFLRPSPAVSATPVAGRKLVQATPVRTSKPAPATVVEPPLSPVLARKAVTRKQSFHPALPSSSTLVGSSSPDRKPMPPAAVGIFETPLKPRSAMDRGELCTPVRPLRLVTGAVAVTATPETKVTAVAGTPEARRRAVAATPEGKKLEGVRERADEEDRKDPSDVGHQPVSIYQQLGWDDDYDLD